MNEDHLHGPENADADPSVNGLTCIHGRIHCVATQNGVEPENEIDRMMIDNFLETIAEVALAVAARDSEGKQRDELD